MRAVILTGTTGYGKSAVAEHIARQLPKAAHVPVDFFLLNPRLEVALARNRTRECWTVSENTLKELHAVFLEGFMTNLLRIDN